MAFGLNISGSTGFSQIDETYKNFVVVRTGLIALNTPQPLLNKNQILFIRPPYGVFVSVYHYSNAFELISLSNANVSYAVCEPAPNVIPTGYGISIIGPNGQVTYDGSQKLISIDGQLTGTPNNTTVALSAPPYGLRYFMVDTFYMIISESAGGSDSYGHRAAIRLNSETSLTTGVVITNEGYNDGPGYYYTYPSNFGFTGYLNL